MTALQMARTTHDRLSRRWTRLRVRRDAWQSRRQTGCLLPREPLVRLYFKTGARWALQAMMLRGIGIFQDPRDEPRSIGGGQDPVGTDDRSSIGKHTSRRPSASRFPDLLPNAPSRNAGPDRDPQGHRGALSSLRHTLKRVEGQPGR